MAETRLTSASFCSRRDFVRLLGAGAGTFLVPIPTLAGRQNMAKIERIEAFPARVPTVARFKFFEGPEGTPMGRPSVMIKITADDGTVGWGESVPIPKWAYETLEAAVTAIDNYLGPAQLAYGYRIVRHLLHDADLFCFPFRNQDAPVGGTHKERRHSPIQPISPCRTQF